MWILNPNTCQSPTGIDILDIILSPLCSKRDGVVPYGDPEWCSFATAKKDHFPDPQRAWSNNSLLSYRHPTKEELTPTFELMLGSGGSEPGFVNAQSALKRALWFQGISSNPRPERLRRFRRANCRRRYCLLVLAGGDFS